MAKDDDGGHDLSVVKGALLAMGALATVVFGLWLFKPLLMLGLIGSAAYVGYRAFGKSKALQASRDQKALSSSDFDKRMRELDNLDRELDIEIRKHSS